MTHANITTRKVYLQASENFDEYSEVLFIASFKNVILAESISSESATGLFVHVHDGHEELQDDSVNFAEYMGKEANETYLFADEEEGFRFALSLVTP